MKRALVFATVVWACTGVPPALDAGTSGGGAGGAAGSTGGGSSGSSAGGSGGSTAGGSATAGGSGGCTTACNCAPGFSCFNAQCIAGTVPVFCCTERPCPAGDFCQEPGGPFDRCPTPDGGRFDAGDRSDAGRFDGGGRPDGGRPDGGCGTACDCAPPQGCVGGRCTSSPTPIYCCKDPLCPAKEVCQFPAGGYGQCGTDGGAPFDAGRPDAGRKQCDTACDCTPGLSCVSGTCLAAFLPVYCCGSAACPMGSQCESDGGVFGLCP